MLRSLGGPTSIYIVIPTFVSGIIECMQACSAFNFECCMQTHVCTYIPAYISVRESNDNEHADAGDYCSAGTRATIPWY